MAGSLDKKEGEALFAQALTSAASEALVTLLETKHLYQKAPIAFDTTLSEVRAQVVSIYQDSFTPSRSIYRAAKLGLAERARVGQNGYPNPAILLQNIKIFCQVCGSSEVFSPLWYKELGQEILATRALNPTLEVPLRDLFQLFVLSYQCQHCKTEPVTFLVRRTKWYFLLEGRSPMEQVEVPREIPKPESGYFRDGVIAYQSGKPLAGILYLRVFLEAFARRQTGYTVRMTGDELMDRYADLIPHEQRSHMPSLKLSYSKLSEAIHAGREDSELFDSESATIHRHFEFRRIFQIADVTAEQKHD